MGDADWIRSASSRRALREEVTRGDIFLCYETDRKLCVGMTRAACDGRDLGEGSLIDFLPPAQAVRFQVPLRRRPDLDHILAFTPQRGRGTIQRIEPDEFGHLIKILERKNPALAPRWRLWIGESAAMDNRRARKQSRYVAGRKASRVGLSSRRGGRRRMGRGRYDGDGLSFRFARDDDPGNKIGNRSPADKQGGRKPNQTNQG